ncbi:MAG: bifunctional oligoribonuclease/PAP phosphatase NrnA [Candidatus Vogelbacteria bacterium]|nr:bifunctional oligoribonuclease/PAP phosphatase NrnA [Candidatus Vogelbacteria bacterium]
MTDKVRQLAPEIWQAVKSAKRVLLTLHPNPDPDSVGSALACYHLLRALGKEPVVIKGDSPLPEYLSFLPGYEAIVPKNYLEIELTDFDLFLILDISSPDRVSNLGEVEFPPPLKTILIDHHVTAEPFADLNLIAPEYPAAAQILFELFKLWEIEVTPSIAACLFVGLYTDTGGFKYPGTKTETFLAAAELVRAAPNFPDLIFELENNNTPGQLRFEGLALSSIEVVGQGKIALIALSLSALAARGLRYEDTQGLGSANHLKSVKGWEIGATLVESMPGVVRVSLRTRDPARFDLSRLAAALGGGGHPAAAGAVLKMPFIAAKELFLQKIGEIYPELR